MALLSLDRHDVLETIRQSNSLHEAFLRVAKLPAVGEYRTATNADRIRSMTDGELAKLFDSWVSDCACNNFPCQKNCSLRDFNCEKSWLKWLREEYKSES